MLLADGRRVIASAKALTTPWDLAIGIGQAIRAVLDVLSSGADRASGASRADVSLVSVSTTLATNAVVENRFSPVCTLLIGFDEAMVERSGLKRHRDGVVVRVPGGHIATGEESEPLDEAAVERAVREYGARVEAFAVAANFSVRNPAHELRARQHHPRAVAEAGDLRARIELEARRAAPCAHRRAERAAHPADPPSHRGARRACWPRSRSMRR